MRVAIVDLVLVIAGYLLVQFVSRALDLPTPGLLAVVAGVLIATWRLAASGESWRTVGIRKPPTWLGLALSVPALYLITIVAVTGLVLPLADALGWPPLELSTYRDVQGNPVALARILLVAWTTAAFGEEMLFRGFLQGRIRTVLSIDTNYGALGPLTDRPRDEPMHVHRPFSSRRTLEHSTRLASPRAPPGRSAQLMDGRPWKHPACEIACTSP